MLLSEPTLKRFEYLTLEDLYHPNLDLAIHRTLLFCTILNTIIFPFMIYIIIKCSTKEMQLYKHLLVIQITFSYLLDLITFSWQPSLLWPLTFGYPNTFINFGSRTLYIFFPIQMAFMFSIVVIHCFLVFYRLAATYTGSCISYVYSNVKVMYSLLICTMLITTIIMVVPLISDEPNAEQVRALAEIEIPVMKKMFEILPRITGYHPKFSNGGIDFIIIFAMISIAVTPIAFIFIFVFFLYRLRYVKIHFTPSTYRLQKMLFKSLVIQIALLNLCILIPSSIFVLTIFFEVRWGSLLASGSVVVISFHMSLDSIVLIYFIKPYRNFILQKLRISSPSPNSVISISSLSAQRRVTIA